MMVGTKRLTVIFVLMAAWGMLEVTDYTAARDARSQGGSNARIQRIAAAAVGASAAAASSGGAGGGPRAARIADEDGWTCPYPRKPISCRSRAIAVQAYKERRVVSCLFDDNSGAHKEQLSQFNKPGGIFEWDRFCDLERPNQLFALTSLTHEDRTRNCCGNDTYKVFITTEPPAIQPYMYEFLKVAAAEFDVVLSLGGEEALPSATVPDSRIMRWSWGSSWVPLDDWAMYPKTQLCSIVASNQKFTVGHRLRHEVVALLNSTFASLECEIMGHGYGRRFGWKRDAHADFMYSFIIENSITGNYMTEKIMDALACGTVPVYWGTPYAREVFGDAIITWETLDDLKRILPTLSPYLYESLLPAVKKAQERARAFVPPERWISDEVFKCAYEWYTEHHDRDCGGM
jgi:hypothetical protein